MEFVLHPLVPLNISDHYNRAKNHRGEILSDVTIGCIMGTHVGTRVDLQDSFEVLYKDGVIKEDLLTQRSLQVKETFPNYSIIGWYCVASAVTPDIINLHNLLSETTKHELILVVYNDRPNKTEEPLTIYTINDNIAVPSTFNLDMLKPESISMDTISRLLPGENSGAHAQYTHGLEILQDTVRLLNDRITTIIAFLEQFETISAVPQAAGSAMQIDDLDSELHKQRILRRINSTARSLPKESDEHSFHGDSELNIAYLSELNDSAAILALTRLVALREHEREMITNFKIAETEMQRRRQRDALEHRHGDHGRRGGFGGGFGGMDMLGGLGSFFGGMGGMGGMSMFGRNRRR
ncbi:putative COP9 signalosome complex subunit 6b [Blattamonas nauphoetae]|uniref:COP9 signalosome complex subunit 6b n=1 Tax=Blattamonas nauphoetae TaxID=2049346 RepID=A0ABQ9WXU6_9EUKA|nr:putative COP9 signalosome complex subunit 6b [Blattamonas nauphoetae]